jgi:hypothetical protein
MEEQKTAGDFPRLRTQSRMVRLHQGQNSFSTLKFSFPMETVMKLHMSLDESRNLMVFLLDENTKILSWIHVYLSLSFRMVTKRISHTILAKHLFSQVDSEGNQYRLFKEIINHRKGNLAVEKSDQFRIDKQTGRS